MYYNVTLHWDEPENYSFLVNADSEKAAITAVKHWLMEMMDFDDFTYASLEAIQIDLPSTDNVVQLL